MTNENQIKLDERLALAASFVRKGATVADVGTDHGYLPVSLLLDEMAAFAYASDVNRMPLEKARANAQKYGVSAKMRFHLSNGLAFLDEEKTESAHPVDDIIICGMGGELIAEILAKSSYGKRDGVHLILQPMTMADKLRVFLAENGYCITDERLTKAAGKIYTVLSAEYDGVFRMPSGAEIALGENNIRHGGTLFLEYAREWTRKLNIKIDGLTVGGLDCSAEKELLDEIEKVIWEHENRKNAPNESDKERID